MESIVGQAIDSDRFIVQVDGYKVSKLIKPQNLVSAVRSFPEQSQSQVARDGLINDLASQHVLLSVSENSPQSGSVQKVNEEVSSALLQSQNAEVRVEVLLLKFSRSPQAFREALLHSAFFSEL